MNLDFSEWRETRPFYGLPAFEMGTKRVRRVIYLCLLPIR